MYLFLLYKILRRTTRYDCLKKSDKMVLKNLIRYIINKYLKEYIEELDYEKVKLDFKHGKVLSVNLPKN